MLNPGGVTPAEVARLEETRRAHHARDVALESRPIPGGGIASRDGSGSWMNYIVGAGLDGPVPREEIERLVDWFRRPAEGLGGGVSPRMETTPYADADLLRDAQELGFRVTDLAHVFARDTRRIDAPGDRKTDVREIDPADAAGVAEFAQTVVHGFYPDGGAPAAAGEVVKRGLLHPRTVGYGAYIGGRMAGAGGLDMGDGVAALMGLGVLPEFRGRGIQQAVIAARIRGAAERGARLVTIVSSPGGPTERNALRAGFTMMYAKIILMGPPVPPAKTPPTGEVGGA